jgi:hypothetical protein
MFFANHCQSSVGTEDVYSENMSTVGGNESIAETNSAYGTWDDRFVPTHLRQVHMRAPHWLIPAVMGRRLTGSQSETSTVDSASVVSSDMASTERGARRAPVPFNAWGPNGEYARMVKTPTVASESTRTVTTARRQPVKQTNSGWAKVVSVPSKRAISRASTDHELADPQACPPAPRLFEEPDGGRHGQQLR